METDAATAPCTPRLSPRETGESVCRLYRRIVEDGADLGKRKGVVRGAPDE
jgi:hypothetical protein